MRRAGASAALALLAVVGCSHATATTAATSARLAAIAGSVGTAEHATYKAVYQTTTAGASQTVTLEQAPPRSRFSSATTSIVDTGTSTYLCLHGSSCIKEATNPMATLTDLFSASTVLRTLQDAEGAAGRVLPVSFSTKTIAQRPCQCFAVNVSGQTDSYCVTAEGILASTKVGASSFVLVSLTTQVPAADFAISN